MIKQTRSIIFVHINILHHYLAFLDIPNLILRVLLLRIKLLLILFYHHGVLLQSEGREKSEKRGTVCQVRGQTGRAGRTRGKVTA